MSYKIINDRPKLIKHFITHPFDLLGLWEISKRVWTYNTPSPNNLKQGEFIFPISRGNKYNKTPKELDGLLIRLIGLGYIIYTGRKEFYKVNGKMIHGKCNVYKWIENDCITIPYTREVIKQHVNVLNEAIPSNTIFKKVGINQKRLVFPSSDSIGLVELSDPGVYER